MLSLRFISIFKEELNKNIKSYNNRIIKNQSLKNKIINYKNIILLSYNQANDTKF